MTTTSLRRHAAKVDPLFVKVKKWVDTIDWSRIVHKTDKGHPNFVLLRVQLTLRYTGPGIGFGFGHTDHWIGFPKRVAR